MGSLPDASQLTGYASLNLSSYGYTGTIPSSYGTLGLLTSLDLSGNALTGDLPSSFSSLTRLTFLSVKANQVTSQGGGEGHGGLRLWGWP